ncbi:MAG: hypothetical protein BWY74_02792 [Firmicutes bacterium ADurb.Bin419]|nr:MAG: hypothetical protein BWY74_02792 [Firmicutes bacterium ADurb.Bin419]
MELLDKPGLPLSNPVSATHTISPSPSYPILKAVSDPIIPVAISLNNSSFTFSSINLTASYFDIFSIFLYFTFTINKFSFLEIIEPLLLIISSSTVFTSSNVDTAISTSVSLFSSVIFLDNSGSILNSGSYSITSATDSILYRLSVFLGLIRQR